MKIKTVLPFFAFIFAISVSIAANFISPPPITAWGKHTSLSCVEGDIQQTQTALEFCDVSHFGTVCTVRVGSVIAGSQIKDAYPTPEDCLGSKLRLND
jgi:hypothetical protein